MQYRAVIFDLDGTLINSLEDLADSVNLMLKSYGFPEHTQAEYRIFLGNGPRNLIERSLPAAKAASSALVDEALADYEKIYAGRFLEKTRAYKGMRETLSQLRTWGLPLGVCTNKQQDDAQNIVRFLFEDQTFRAVVGDHAGSRRKPDPTNVLAMAASFGVQPAEVAYLGDTSVDMKTAVNAGFLPVGVLWGFRGREELIENGAKVLLEEPADLLKKVEFKH